MGIRGFDGFQHPSERPVISLVCFGRIEQDLEETLLHSLEQFIVPFRDSIPASPEFSCIHEPDPVTKPSAGRKDAYLPLLQQAGGNIVLGVTASGLYDRALGRFIFSYGHMGGSGILSTYRFQKETGSRRLFLERMAKQVLKTLALACTVESCPDAGCVISYHRWAEDLDRNRYICEPCRKKFARNLSFFLDTGSQGASLKHGGEGS